MNLSRIFLAILTQIIFLVECSFQNEPPMPKEMPNDFDFSVRFGITSKNEINTYEDQVTKDLVSEGTAKTDLALTDDEMKSIYDRMQEINILRELDLKPRSTSCSQTPYSEDYWKIRVDGQTKQFHWSEEHCSQGKDAKAMEELRDFIFNIVKNKDEYKNLPEAVGGYE